MARKLTLRRAPAGVSARDCKPVLRHSQLCRHNFPDLLSEMAHDLSGREWGVTTPSRDVPDNGRSVRACDGAAVTTR